MTPGTLAHRTMVNFKVEQRLSNPASCSNKGGRSIIRCWYFAERSAGNRAIGPTCVVLALRSLMQELGNEERLNPGWSGAWNILAGMSSRFKGLRRLSRSTSRRQPRSIIQLAI